MSRNALLAAALVIAAVAAMIAGCSGTPKESGTLSGAAIFDPQRFSMAIYDVTPPAGDNGTHEGLIVSSNTSGSEGDVLTSIAFHDNVSTRADTLISHDHTKTLNVLISDINESTMQFSGGWPMFNMTVLDRAWNSLDDVYGLTGSANVTVPAGNFSRCQVYGSDKTVVTGDESTAVQVRYYIHASSPVPVMYEVKLPEGTYTYRLKHVYEPGDVASTPERVVQSFFDDLDNGRLAEAFDCLVTYDQNRSSFNAPDAATNHQFLENMNQTYRTGDQSYRVQYVDVRAVVPVTSLESASMSLVQWESTHYQVGTLSVYRLSGSFYVTEIGGQWRIIV
jgi:hypothetical protein